MRLTLRHTLTHLTDASAGDGELVGRFRDANDPAAFAELVRRHGPMVFGACRRMLPCRQDAEDAFQATFLVLAVKPGAVRPADRVGAWLHGVACRVALKARRSAARRAAAESRAAELRPPTTPPDPDLAPLLDEAVRALPEKYRLPVVECHLAGRSRAEAAARLGCTEGTLSGRLARALDLLAARLARRGVGLPAAAVAGVLSAGPLLAAVPAGVVASTVSVADLVRSGLAPAAGVVGTLTRGVLGAMWWKKFTTVTVVGLAVIVAVGLLGPRLLPARPVPAAAPVPPPGPKWEVTHTITREHPVTEVAVRKDSVAFADGGGNVLLWDVGDKDPQLLVKGNNLKGVDRPVAQLTYTPDRKYLYFAADNGKGFWRHDFKEGRTYGVAGTGEIICAAFFEDGRTWVETFARKRSIIVLRRNEWDDPSIVREILRFDADATHVVPGPGNTRLVAVTADGKVLIIDRDGLRGPNFTGRAVGTSRP